MGKDTFELGGREWPKVKWWKLKNMRAVYLTLWAALITSATNGYDGSLMNGLQAMPSWLDTYNHPSGSITGLLVSIFSLGGFVGAPLAPYVADGLGRRTGVVVGCVIMLVGVAMVSIGFHVALFVLGRFILGFGLGIAQGCAPLLMSEVVHPQHRAPYSTMYNSLWYVGSLIGACVALGADKISGNWSWRLPCLLQAVPSITQLIFIWMVPESPRWLISKGRLAQAKTILAKIHAEGDEDDELVNVEFDEIQQTIKLEKEYEKDSWSQLWSTAGMRHRLIILVSIGFFSQWSGNGLISYYLPKVLDLIGVKSSQAQLRLNFYLQVVNVISGVGICFFVDYFGRVPLFRTSTIGMTVSYVAMTIGLGRYSATSGGDAGAANAFIVFMFFYYISYNIAFNGLLVSYSTEILPYRLRAKGLNVMFMCVDLSLFFNSYVNPIALDAIKWKYYIVYCCWLLFEIAVVFRYYIETKKVVLEEIAKLFDGDTAIVGGAAASEKVRHLGDIEAVEHVDGNEEHSKED